MLNNYLTMMSWYMIHDPKKLYALQKRLLTIYKVNQNQNSSHGNNNGNGGNNVSNGYGNNYNQGYIG